MQNLLQHVDLRQPNFLHKMFGQTVLNSNVVIEINNLLVAKPILSIRAEEISDIIGKYKINVFKTYPKNFYEFYAVFLNHCLKDKCLSPDEIRDLQHLKELLCLNDKEIEKIHNHLTKLIYQKSMQEAVSDGRLDEHEKEFLRKLEIELKLPSELAEKVSNEVRGKFINNYLNQAVSDERLSPDEEREFEIMCKSLMVDAKLDGKTKAQLDKFRLYWVIENGELPAQQVGINLQKSEECYFSADVDWFEQRTVTQRINSSGATARIKIMKGVYYRVGTRSTQRITAEEWKHIDRGTMYLTNKRVIFMGSKKNSNVRLDKILSFTPYSDGIGLEKDTGRSPLLKFNNDVEVCSLLLSRLLREA